MQTRTLGSNFPETLQYRLNVTFDLLAHELISSPETDRIVDGGVTSFTRFSIVASEF
jgi:hypothetical protein